MRDYKGWTANERLASLKKTKAAIAAGLIPPPTKCNRCGKETGRIDYHNHDYSDPIKYLEQICQGCHTRLHRLENREIDSKTFNEQVVTDIQDKGSLKPVAMEPTEKEKKTMNRFDQNPNYIKWQQKLTKKGMDGRFQNYLQTADEFNFNIQFFSSKSVSLFFEGVPFVAMYPATSRADSGLWIGYCVTNCDKKFKVKYLQESLPKDFENKYHDQFGKEWRFGYFSSAEETKCFIERLHRLLNGLKV